jgi:hypothetical protein
MAETYQVTLSLTYRNESGRKLLSGVIPAQQAGVSDVKTTQTIASTPTLLEVGEEITDAGLLVCLIKNLDRDRTVTVYSDNGSTVLDTISPQSVLLVEPEGEYIPYVAASSRTVEIEFLAVSVPPP